VFKEATSQMQAPGRGAIQQQPVSLASDMAPAVECKDAFLPSCLLYRPT
jgi:hypothetical protein